MDHLWVAMIAGFLIMLASMASVELGVSVALIEISLCTASTPGSSTGPSSRCW